MNTRVRNVLATVSLFVACSSHASTTMTADQCLADAKQAITGDKLAEAEKILHQHLQHRPDDTDAQFTLARVLAWQKHYPQALAAFDRLIARQAENSDYLLARARLHMWMNNDMLAIQDLETARKLSPGYLELWQLQLQLMARKPGDAFNTLLQQAQQRFPQIDWQILQVENPLPEKSASTVSDGHYQLAAIAGYDRLDNNRDSWNSTSVVLSGRTNNGSGRVQIDSYQRFSLRDWQLAGGISLPLVDGWSSAVNASVSPTAKVIARNRLEIILSKRLAGGLNLHAGAQYANFAVTDSRQLHVTGEYYWSLWRIAYSYRLIDVANAGTGHNQRVQLTRSYAANGSNMTLSVANGKDVEYDGTATPPVSDVRTVSIYGRHILHTDMALSWSVFHHQQGNFYNRNGLVLGIQFDF